MLRAKSGVATYSVHVNMHVALGCIDLEATFRFEGRGDNHLRPHPIIEPMFLSSIVQSLVGISWFVEEILSRCVQLSRSRAEEVGCDDVVPCRKILNFRQRCLMSLNGMVSWTGYVLGSQ